MNPQQLTNRSKRAKNSPTLDQNPASEHRVSASSRANAFPPLTVTFPVDPFVTIVSRHVKVSAQARQRIVRDLVEMLGHADIQLVSTIDNSTAGQTEQVEGDDQVLTTEQAAQIVGVSRPFMVKLIDTGAVELHQKVGNQRRVLRSAVLRWRADERSRQSKALKELANSLDEEIFSS